MDQVISNTVVRREKLAPIRMTTGGESKHPIVIDRGRVKEWVGFTWIDCGYPDAAEQAKYPVVIENDEDIPPATTLL